jgi:hypothetical protein
LGMEKRLEKKEIRKREGGACGADDAWQCGADALLLSRSHDANDPTAARPEDAARAILRGISSVSLPEIWSTSTVIVRLLNVLNCDFTP